MRQPQQPQPTPGTFAGEMTPSGLSQVGPKCLTFIETFIEALNVGIPGQA